MIALLYAIDRPQVVKELKRSEYRPRMAVLVGGCLGWAACGIVSSLHGCSIALAALPSRASRLHYAAASAAHMPAAPRPACCPRPAALQGSRKHYCINMHATKQSSIDEACEELLKESQVGAHVLTCW